MSFKLTSDSLVIIFILTVITSNANGEGLEYPSLQEAIAIALGEPTSFEMGCIEKDCTSHFLEKDCAILQSTVDDVSLDVSSVMTSFRQCFSNGVCGFKYEPFAFPRFLQSFNALGYNGSCVSEDSIVLDGLSEYRFSVQPNRQQAIQPAVKINFAWPELRSTGVALTCTITKQIPTNAIAGLFQVFVNIATTVAGFSITDAPLTTRLSVEDVRYSIEGIIYATFDQTNGSVSTMMYKGAPRATVTLNFSSSIAKQWQQLVQLIISRLVTSRMFSNFVFNTFIHYLTAVLNAFMSNCTKISTHGNDLL